MTTMDVVMECIGDIVKRVLARIRQDQASRAELKKWIKARRRREGNPTEVPARTKTNREDNETRIV